MPSQVTIHTLIRDPIYRAWLQKVPKITVVGQTPPWRVWVLLHDGRWAKKEFEKYSEAYNWMVKNYKNHADVVITSKRQEFKPPVVSKNGKRRYWILPASPAVSAGHRWCGYCRRPSLFSVFKRHHAVKITDFHALRCVTCGVRYEFIRKY